MPGPAFDRDGIQGAFENVQVSDLTVDETCTLKPALTKRACVDDTTFESRLPKIAAQPVLSA
ncbi:MAG TPA: hypothetical protein VIM98_16130 [Dyella sp.]|uniref:hypothetical protein n=1 Tax=Dyella sp. TaxID=1869338 RepID=UPI002F94A2A8